MRDGWRHIYLGVRLLVAVALFPLGKLCGWMLADLRTSARLERGLVLVLPGIEGESFLNHGIARGLDDGGVGASIEIDDWTTGFMPFFFYHLRNDTLHNEQADRIARRIIDYRKSHPGRPIYLVGHSGGGGLIVMILEKLPPDVLVTSVVLLVAAISGQYDLSRALPHVEKKFVNYRAFGDLFFLGVGNLVFGTFDGRHAPGAGLTGFHNPENLSDEARHNYSTRLHQITYRLSMLADFNFGGHMSVTSRPFIARTIAPYLKESANDQSTNANSFVSNNA